MPASGFVGTVTKPHRTKQLCFVLGFLVFATVSALAMKPTVTVNLNDVRDFTNTPVPDYPKTALAKNWGGTGLFQLQFDHSGSVTRVEVMMTTDHDLLDQTAVAALTQWKCRPAGPSSAMVMMGFKANKSDEPLDLRKNPDEQKKGHWLSAPHPNYPLAARQLRITGKGKFMLHFGPDGRCDKVVPIESMGGGRQILEYECISTFLRWRCVPGAYKKVIVPIRFTINGNGV